ncbi:MAG TPA: DUF1326 domain-containing protein [Steroidobacteraceae bacterium]|nr:DUF1326 domain-containing protein [Steroidobacteraceae bacterium]
MNQVDWYVEGPSYGSCNCSYGCPCQFEDLPTHGHCRGFEVLRVDKGHFGDVKLDAVKAALIYAWPGPVFEGKGAMQVVIDASASAQQREALTRILHGEETAEAATHWWVFRKMSDTVHPPIFKPIAYEVDIEARTASVSIPGLLESTGSPIRSPVSGQPHRVRINIPDGIEFEVAEIGSATTRSTGVIKLDLKNTYGQFNLLRHSGSGVVHG